MSTLGGTRTRSLRVEGPASSPASTTRAWEAPAAGIEPAISPVTTSASFQLDHTGLGQAEAAGLEPAGGGGRRRVSNALPFQLGHASLKAEGEGVEPPRPERADPFSGRDTAPMAVLPSSGPGRRRTCTLPVKSRELCRVVELRSRGDVTGRGRTCDAPRFKRALYRLSYGHVNGRSRARTGALLLIREALCQLSDPPSTYAYLSSPPPGSSTHTRPLVHASVITYRDVGRVANEVVYATRLPFDPGSPAWGAASYVEGCWSPVLAKCHCKLALESNTYIHARNPASQRRGPFSLKRGLKY